jgi:hypothetical protein
MRALYAVCKAGLALALSGCSSLDQVEAREKKAVEIYSAGSSFSGTGRRLLLFSRAHWEQWGLTCTAARKVGEGNYTQAGGRLTLLERDGSTQTFHVVQHAGARYLVETPFTPETKSGAIDFGNALKKSE